MSMPPKEDVGFSWRNFWVDLLKGAGTGLLKYDGSRAAQAALAGLEVFDAAQERRRQPGSQGPGAPYGDMLLKLWSAMSPEEQAAFHRLTPEEQAAYTEEWAEEASEDAPRGKVPPFDWRGRLPATQAPLSHAGRPISINPLDGWRLQSVSPFGPGDGLNLPANRR